MCDELRLEYVPLSIAVKWDWIKNPKKHDIGGLIQSIRKYGFRDTPEYDGTLGAFAQGNGRVKALAMMFAEDQDDRPRYIRLLDDLDWQADGLSFRPGEWAIPVQFGADSASVAAAQAYAIDVHNLVVSAGDAELWDMLTMYDRQQLAEITSALEHTGQELVTMDSQSMSIVAGKEEEQPDKTEELRWSFQVHFEAPAELLEELEGLMGSYFMPRSKRNLMPEFFTAMVRDYCEHGAPVILLDKELEA